MKGNEIIVAAPPRGVMLGGILGDTSLPGTKMQIQAGTAPLNGRHTWVHYQPSADNDPRVTAILVNDTLQGQLPNPATQLLPIGSWIWLYFPLPGEDMNVLCKGQQGTGSANAFTIGERLQPEHTTGTYIAQNTSANKADFVCLEHIDLTPDVAGLVWAMMQ